MITAVTGNPGEGKTAWIVRFVIIPCLLNSTRQVFTNITIDKDKLKVYMENMGGEFDPDQLVCFPYVQAVDELEKGQEATVEFKYHAVQPFVTCHKDEVDKYDDPDLYKRATSDNPDYFTIYKRFERSSMFNPAKFWESCARGALVVLDEAAKYLNSYVFGANEGGKLLGKYAMIHRHQHQDVYFGVQNLGHFSKQARDLTAQQIKLYNYHQHPILGVKLNVFFIRKVQLGLGQAVTPKLEWRRYDSKIFDLYDTFQFEGSVNTLEEQTFIKKKVVKVTFFQRVKAYLFGNPFLVGITIAILIIVFALKNLFGNMITTLDAPSKAKTEAVKSNPIKNETKTDSLSSSDTSIVSSEPSTGYAKPPITSPSFGRIAPKQNPRRETTNTFSDLKPRGYSLSTSDTSRGSN